nr:transposase [Sphingomonas jeddahensis]
MRGFRHWRWHLDEIYVKLNGEMVYLWRAVALSNQPGRLCSGGCQCSRTRPARSWMRRGLTSDVEVEQAGTRVHPPVSRCFDNTRQPNRNALCRLQQLVSPPPRSMVGARFNRIFSDTAHAPRQEIAWAEFAFFRQRQVRSH